MKTRLNSQLPTGLCLRFYYSTRIFTSRELQVECGVLNSIGRGVFIGVPGAITSLIKSEIRQLLAGRPSHVVGLPWGSASTDSRPWVTFLHLLETHGRLQSRADRPPTGPTRQWPLHTASSCQVHSSGDTNFGRIPHFHVIS
jgi:hypothetical protein